MNYRLAAAVLIFVLALCIQFSLGAAGVWLDLALTTLIVFAFFFEWTTLAVFVLFAVFLLDPERGFDPAFILFAILPFAAYAFRKLLALTPWAGVPLAISTGFLLWYLILAPSLFARALPLVVFDIAGMLVFGEIVFGLLRAAER
jgi:hypothetical protein